MLQSVAFRKWKTTFPAMGKLLSKIFGNKEMRILMLGLDAAGKTSKPSAEKPFVSHGFYLFVYFGQDV